MLAHALVCALAATAAAPEGSSETADLPSTEAPVAAPAASTPASAQVAAARASVLVLATQLLGAAPGLEAPVADALAAAVGRDARYEVVTTEDLKEVAAHLQERQLVGCDADQACLARLVELSAAAFVVSSSVGMVGDSILLTVTLVDAGDALRTRRTTRSARTLRELLPLIEAAVTELLGAPTAPAGSTVAAAAAFSCAVLDLKASGIEQHLADNLTQVLSTEIKTFEGARVISRDDVVALLKLEGNSQMLGCDDMSCMAEISGALGVDKLVVGSVGHVGDTHVVSLRLINATAVQVENRVTESYSGTADQLIGAVRKAARDLFGRHAETPGQLIMSVSEVGADVYLDGKRVGQAPLPPLQGLAPGRYAVRVTHDGFYDFNSELYVGPADTTGGWVQLEEIPVAWYERWWVWTLVGTAVVGGVVTGVVLGTQTTGGLNVHTEVPGGWR